MKDKENQRTVRIRRANTDWWIGEKAIVGANGLTYIAYVTDMGEIHVKEFDAKCSRTPSRDVTVCYLNCNYADEHNAPSLCILSDGRILVAYTGHGATHSLTYRITSRPYDLLSFGQPHVLAYHASVTYAQIYENTKRDELWLFCRVDRVTWEIRVSKDRGESFEAPRTFLRSDAGGLFYFNVRKQLTRTGEQWFFALYGHPRISADHTIRAGILDSNGVFRKMNGEPLGVDVFSDNGKTLDLSALDTVYASPEGTTVRLLEVSPTEPMRVGLCTFTLDKPETCTYYTASWHEGGFVLSAPICAGGEFLSTEKQLDGSQTYVGGMAYYFGVGEAGLHRHYPGHTTTNRVYIARFDGKDRILESYQSFDGGETYVPEETLRRIPGTGDPDRDIKIWRPIVPIHAQDNLPVYWHEGHYSGHTGGWHSDAVMYVSYDD